MRMRREEGESPGVMMEPMIDCVFLLLIFFLVAATIRKKHNELPLELPSAGHAMAKKASDDTLVISIMLPEDTRKMKSGADPSAFQFYRYGFSTVGEQDKSSGGAREMVSWELLLGQVRAAVAAKADRVVRIDADRRVPYGLVAQLIDHLQLYKLPKVGLRTLD